MKLQYLLIIFTITIYNVDIFQQYENRYNLSQSRLVHQKYRCYKYFADNVYFKYTDKKCQKYKYDYLNFNLEKSSFMFYCIITNIIIISMIYISLLFN